MLLVLVAVKEFFFLLVHEYFMFMIARQRYNVRRLRGTRCFSETPILGSGHNRWSKIKHDKAKADVSILRFWTEIARLFNSFIGISDEAANCCR